LLTRPKTSFERAYRVEKDVKVKEMMLLVLNVVYHGKIASQVAKDIHIEVEGLGLSMVEKI
jgi:hypothetical protein